MAFYGTTFSPDEILAADTGIAGSGELEIIKSCSYVPTAGAKPINLHFKPVLGARRDAEDKRVKKSRILANTLRKDSCR